ncbi:MAG: hypothetical protein RR140_02290 [Clostridia bacterium]
MFEAVQAGTLVGLVLNEKYNKINGFVIEGGERYFLPANKVFVYGDVFLIKNKTVLQVFDNKTNDFIGKNCFLTNGKTIGALMDIDFEPNGKIMDFCFQDCTKTASELLYFNQVGIFQSEKRILKTNIFPRANNQTETDKIMVKTLKEILPVKIETDSQALIGRLVLKDLFGQSNEIIAKKNQIVNQKTIEIVKRHNKINDLFFSVGAK